jgi:MFS-type transporter involved in bile tolerance (Atg22 family)
MLEIKQLEIWSSCFGYFVSLITNTIVFSLLIKSFLKFKAKNQKIIPGIIFIIILPFIIISIVIVKTIVQTKEKAMEKRENTCHMILICTLTIIVSLSPIFNFSRAHKLHKIEIIPEYTIICAVFNLNAIIHPKKRVEKPLFCAFRQKKRCSDR